MENFSVNSARSFIGRNVNLHLKDGAVIVNVQVTGIRKGAGRNNIVEYMTYRKRTSVKILLKNVAYAELLNSNLLQSAA